MRAEVEGLEILDSVSGPVIFAANHQSHTDTFLILKALPPCFRNNLAIAIADLGDSPLSRLRTFLSHRLMGMGVVASRPDRLRHGFEHLCKASRRQASILIYPEGERSHSNEIWPFRHGVGWLAHELRLPIVPLYIEDTYRIRRTVFRTRVRMRIGHPLFNDGADFRELAYRAEQAVRDLAAASRA